MSGPGAAARGGLLGPPGSLQRRLLLAAGAVLGIALLAATLSVGFILHRFVRGQVDGRLDDRILALVSDLRPAPGGGLSLGRERDGPPFDRPRSGWYWQVSRGGDRLGSASLAGQVLSVPDLPARRARAEAFVPADGLGPWGESLILRVLTVPGTGEDPPTVLVASAPAAALRGPVLEALRTLALCLGVIGLFLFAGVLVQVRLGLRPLRGLRDQIAGIRAGTLDRLPDRQPAEVRPLVAEVNALLDRNAAHLDHARAHVANLAHGLKTPLATLSLALAETGSERDRGLARLVAGMDQRIRHHLRRARAAAAGGPVRARADLAAHLADLRLALLRIHADKAIAFAIDVPDGLGVACDPQDLDEMLGNLVDNACQWCRGRVRVAARRTDTAVLVSIADDGPGLPPPARETILRRGARLDESQPGHGFGLPIALELAAFYGGSLTLGTSDLGGLAVEIALPA